MCYISWGYSRFVVGLINGRFFMNIALGFDFVLGRFGIFIGWVESNQENIENIDPQFSINPLCKWIQWIFVYEYFVLNEWAIEFSRWWTLCVEWAIEFSLWSFELYMNTLKTIGLILYSFTWAFVLFLYFFLL